MHLILDVYLLPFATNILGSIRNITLNLFKNLIYSFIMEIGAVKQAFNNELILLKKKLNQAKIQIINKLTRKAKSFLEKKCPEKFKEKLKRKAEAAVNEVLILKKIKPKDLARFIVTHKGELNTYLNKPAVDNDKACARLLLHKSLQDKYKFLRGRFSSVPVEDLLMSREERRKLKKEAKEKQKNKGKNDTKIVNSAGNWDVEDVDMPAVKLSDNESLNEEEEGSDPAESSDDERAIVNEEDSPGNGSDDKSDDAVITKPDSESADASDVDDKEDNGKNESDDDDDDEVANEGKFVKVTPEKKESITHHSNKAPVAITDLKITGKGNKKLEKKVNDKNKQSKNKNLKEKMLSRNFKKDVVENLVQETKTVDPFFITSTGGNYMSVVEPRQPDEVKEVHRQGNRKVRRAVMFGHVPNIKPRRHNVEQNNRFNRNNDSFNKNDSFKKYNNNNDHSDRRNNFSSKNGETQIEKPEKLHPSWEAKKKQSGILPFQGKKIVFGES